MGVSQSTMHKTSLRKQPGMEAAENETSEVRYVSMEDITAEMELVFGKEALENNGAGLRRKLDGMPCDRGGGEKDVITFGQEEWGTCYTMNHCLCGLMPMQMAYWCPYRCRVDCAGGSCATPEECPNGFNVDDTGAVVDYVGTLPPPPWQYWPVNMGPACPWYANPAAPTATPAPVTPAPTPAPTVSPTPAATSGSDNDAVECGFPQILWGC